VSTSADETQDRHLDQRNDQANRHQREEKGPDLPAIAAKIGDQVSRRHAVVVIAKGIDQGFKKAKHHQASKQIMSRQVG